MILKHPLRKHLLMDQIHRELRLVNKVQLGPSLLMEQIRKRHNHKLNKQTHLVPKQLPLTEQIHLPLIQTLLKQQPRYQQVLVLS